MSLSANTTCGLQTLAVTGAGILTGMNITLSCLMVPRLLELPTPLLLQAWKRTYLLGAKVGPGLSLISTISLLTLAYDAHSLTGRLVSGTAQGIAKWKCYAGAAGLLIGIVPYTILMMGPGVNKKLMDAANSVEVGTEKKFGAAEADSVKKTLDQWGLWNLGRAVLTGLGCVVAVWTSVA